MLDLDDAAKRVDLLLALGEAICPRRTRGERRPRLQAFALAEANHDSQRAGQAALCALDSYSAPAGPKATTMPISGGGPGRADLHAQDGTTERVYADIYYALSLIVLASQPPAMST